MEMSCLVLTLQLEPWRNHSTGQFLLYMNNSISSFSTQPGAGDTLMVGDARMAQCHCHSSVWEKEGRKTQVHWGSVKVTSRPTSELWLFYSLLCSCSRLGAGCASSSSLSRWPTPALCHPVTNLKQILALHIPSTCHLSTKDMTRAVRAFSQMNVK